MTVFPHIRRHTLNIEQTINKILDELERLLLDQVHLNDPQRFLEQLASLWIYFHLMSDEDRDYIQCAKVVLEDKIEKHYSKLTPMLVAEEFASI